MIHRSPAMSFSCITIHWSRGVAISPGRQKILSTSTTGNPAMSPKRLARVDLPDAPRPRMTTRFIVFSFTQIAVWFHGGGLLDNRFRTRRLVNELTAEVLAASSRFGDLPGTCDYFRVGRDWGEITSFSTANSYSLPLSRRSLPIATQPQKQQGRPPSRAP